MFASRDIDALSSKYAFVRLRAVKKLAKSNEHELTENCNLQIHTDYSFSPYTPSLAAFMAHKFNIRIVGITDNYTLRGAKEFIKACNALKLTYSVGTKIRVSIADCDIKMANAVLFGIPQKEHKKLQKRLEIYRENQTENIKATLRAVNSMVASKGVVIDFQQDVLPCIKKRKDMVLLSIYVFFALAKKLEVRCGRENVLSILKEWQITLNDAQEKLLLDKDNPYYVYDLAGLLFLNREKFNCNKSYRPAIEATALAKEFGAISAIECDFNKVLDKTEENLKKVRNFITCVKSCGFNAVCFNPFMFDEQMRLEIFNLLKENEMLALNLSNVKFPRQQFETVFPDEMSKSIMTQSAYVVVGSEMSANQNGESFVRSNLKKQSFDEKITLFAKIGRGE